MSWGKIENTLLLFTATVRLTMQVNTFSVSDFKDPPLFKNAFLLLFLDLDVFTVQNNVCLETLEGCHIHQMKRESSSVALL